MKITTCPHCDGRVCYIEELVRKRSYRPNEVQCDSCDGWLIIPEALVEIINSVLIELFGTSIVVFDDGVTIRYTEELALRVRINATFQKLHLPIPNYALQIDDNVLVVVIKKGYQQ